MKLAKAIFAVLLALSSPIGVLLYLAIVHESIIAMVLLTSSAAVFLVLVGSVMTIVGQNAHARISNTQMSLNMTENSSIAKAYENVLGAAMSIRKAEGVMARRTPELEENNPPLIVDSDAFSELDMYEEVQ